MRTSFWVGTTLALSVIACGGDDGGGSGIENGGNAGSGGSAGAAAGKGGSLSIGGTPSAGASNAGSAGAAGSSSMAGTAGAGGSQGGSASGAGGSSNAGTAGYGGSGVLEPPMGTVQKCFGVGCPHQECDNNKAQMKTLCSDAYDGPVSASSTFCAPGASNYCLSINDDPGLQINVYYSVSCAGTVATIFKCDSGCGILGDEVYRCR